MGSLPMSSRLKYANRFALNLLRLAVNDVKIVNGIKTVVNVGGMFARIVNHLPVEHQYQFAIEHSEYIKDGYMLADLINPASKLSETLRVQLAKSLVVKIINDTQLVKQSSRLCALSQFSSILSHLPISERVSFVKLYYPQIALDRNVWDLRTSINYFQDGYDRLDMALSLSLNMVFTRNTNIHELLLEIIKNNYESFSKTGNYNFYPSGCITSYVDLCYSNFKGNQDTFTTFLDVLITDMRKQNEGKELTNKLKLDSVTNQVWMTMIYEKLVVNSANIANEKFDELRESKTICNSFRDVQDIITGYLVDCSMFKSSSNKALIVEESKHGNVNNKKL